MDENRKNCNCKENHCMSAYQQDEKKKKKKKKQEICGWAGPEKNTMPCSGGSPVRRDFPLLLNQTILLPRLPPSHTAAFLTAKTAILVPSQAGAISVPSTRTACTCEPSRGLQLMEGLLDPPRDLLARRERGRLWSLPLTASLLSRLSSLSMSLACKTCLETNPRWPTSLDL